MDSSESIVVFLKGQISDFQSKMSAAGAETDKFGAKTQSGFQKFQQMSTTALLAVGAAAVAVGVYGLKMADEYEASHARLETAVKNSGGSFEELKGKVADTDRAMESLGFTNADTESSIATLTGATHDAQKAMSLESLAADIARGRHVDLATATGILVKVETGHVSLLSKLGINTKDATGATISQEEAIKRLSQLYGGNAQAYAGTFAGKLEVLKTKGADLAKNIGMALIPVIEQLVSVGAGVVTFLQDANAATDGWLGKTALFVAGGVLMVGVITKLIAVGQAFEAQLVQIAAKFILVDEEGAVTASTLGVVAGAMGSVALGAGIMYGAVKLLEAIEPDPYKKLRDTQKATEQAVLSTGQLIGDQASQAATQLGVSGAAIDAYRNALLAGVPQSQAFAAALKANTVAGGDNAAELKTVTDQVDKYVATLSPLQRAQAAVSAAQAKYTNDLALGHLPNVILQDDLKKVAAAKAAVAKITGEETKASNANGVATAAQIAAQKAAQAADKERQTSIADLAKVVGTADAKIVASTSATTDQIKAMTEQAKQMDSDFSSSFDSAASVLDKFKDKSHVDFNSFIADQMKALAATENWSTNIAQLAKDGIDKGFLQTLIKAGPAEAGLVQSILDNVKHGSIQAVNTIAVGTAQAKAKTEAALNGLVTGASSASSQINSLHPHFTISIDTAQAIQALHNTQSALQGLGSVTVTGPRGPVGFVVHGGGWAKGGTIGPGDAGWVGEAGPEFAMGLPGGGVQIFSHGDQPASLSTASVGGGDVNITNHIEINAAGLDERQLENVIVGALEKNGAASARGLHNYRRVNSRLPWE